MYIAVVRTSGRYGSEANAYEFSSEEKLMEFLNNRSSLHNIRIFSAEELIIKRETSLMPKVKKEKDWTKTYR